MGSESTAAGGVQISKDHPKGPPRWFVGKGAGVKSTPTDHAKGCLIIGSPSSEIAVLTIQRLDNEGKPLDWKYKVVWKVEHENGYTSGEVEMSVRELAAAFGYFGKGIPGYNGFADGGEALVEMSGYPCHAAAQGLFFRFGPYLNIPHPGCGVQGDPNMSIWLNKEIVSAVSDILPPDLVFR